MLSSENQTNKTPPDQDLKAGDSSSSAKQRIKLIFEPRSVVLIGSSRLVEDVGMTSPKLFNNIAHNMNKYFKFEFKSLDIETGDAVPKTDLPGILLACDVGLMILLHVGQDRPVTPNKIFDYMFL